MADKKVTQLTGLTQLNQADLLLVIDDPNGTPVSKKMTVKNFFGFIPANTAISANVTVTRGTSTAPTRVLLAANTTTTQHLFANTLQLTKYGAPSSNSTTATLTGTSFTGAIPVGTMWFSNTFLYIATDVGTIKRVALSVF